VLRKRWAAYPDGFVDFGECGEAILARVSADQLADNHVGPIEWRRTKLVPAGYWANTYPYCSATFGNFPLHEGLLDAYNEGVGRHQLPGFWVALPVGAFQSDEDYWAQEAYENGWHQDEALAPPSEEQVDPVRVGQARRAPADAPVGLATRLRRRLGRS
jgi:hypothetical protein